jgi:hypothetical protein
MKLDFDASNVLYFTGAFLGALTVLYFGASYVLQLSPTVKSFLLLTGFAAFFVEGYDLFSREKKLLSNLSYVLAGVTYLVFIVYTAAKFNFTEEQVLLLLGVSSVLFTALGYAVREDKFELAHGDARKILAALAVLVAAVCVFDATGAHPQYHLELQDDAEIIEDRETVLGTLEASNDFLLSRNMELPDYSACIYTPNRTRGFVSVEDEGEPIIAGGTTRRFNLMLNAAPARAEENVSGIHYPVELESSCPDESEEQKIVVVQQERNEFVVE